MRKGCEEDLSCQVRIYNPDVGHVVTEAIEVLDGKLRLGADELEELRDDGPRLVGGCLEGSHQERDAKVAGDLLLPLVPS
jgi:hypothetical protein